MSKKDNTSLKHYWENDSMSAEIVGLFILLTPMNVMYSTTFKAEMSTWYIATRAREHGWMCMLEVMVLCVDG